jgi:hypothetical protein
MSEPRPSRRDFLLRASAFATFASMPWPLMASSGRLAGPDEERLAASVSKLRAEGLTASDVAFGRAVIRAAELAIGTPYEAGTLESYLRDGGSPHREPLTVTLTRFDCVTLVEASIAVARLAARTGSPAWPAFAREVERMRYRSGLRKGYASRLHYFSEWIGDGARRGLLADLGPSLGGTADERPLRFMTGHRASYPALADDGAFLEIGAMERQLDGAPRYFVPRASLDDVADRIETGDVVAFVTAIPGLDVTHAALAWRDAHALRVLHAPLSGGVVEVTRATLPEYVAAIRSCTGILVARPLTAP